MGDRVKKICFVTTVSITVQAFIRPLLTYLLENTDWELTVICDDDPQIRQWLPEAVRYIPVSMKRGISLGGIGAMVKIAKIFRKEKFDLVQYSTPNASLYASMAAKLAGIPVRLYCQWGIAYVGFQGLKRRIFKMMEKFVCALSTRIEPDSFGNLNFSRQEGLYPPQKSGVIWNGSASGVCLDKFDIRQKDLWHEEIRTRLGIEKTAFVYGFIGRINRDKGINELFTAFRRIAGEHLDTYLILVGPPDKDEGLDPELYAWAKEEPRVIFCGFSTEVEKYMAAMDVYILPSYREGFGSAVVEAEAMGVPVIISDIPGPRDAMIENATGLVVRKADVQTLYEAMIRIKSDDLLRQSLGRAACELAKEKFEQTQLMGHILADREQLMACDKVRNTE